MGNRDNDARQWTTWIRNELAKAARWFSPHPRQPRRLVLAGLPLAVAAIAALVTTALLAAPSSSTRSSLGEGSSLQTPPAVADAARAALGPASAYRNAQRTASPGASAVLTGGGGSPSAGAFGTARNVSARAGRPSAHPSSVGTSTYRHRPPRPGISLTPSRTEPYYACPTGFCEAIVDPTPVRQDGHWKLPGATRALEGSGELGGFSPADLRSAYNIPETGGEGQTIAVVDAFGYAAAEADLAKYREEYGLPKCTSEGSTPAEKCFRKLNQRGVEGSYPPEEGGWELETALDLDMASAACPHCHILLVEADNNGMANLGAAAKKAAEEEGVKEVSNSYGIAEEALSSGLFEELNADYSHSGVMFTAASGDGGFDGYLYGNQSPWIPAAAPTVVSVGGTALTKASNSRHWSEETWSASGGGCSAAEPKPAWQTDTGCAHRMDNDVSAVAAPETPVSVRMKGSWWLVGGTSAASPLIAGIEAHASTFAHSLSGADGFYSDPAAIFDVTSGSNGECEIVYFCTAGPGYDGPTGVGSPNGPLTLTALPPIGGTDPASSVTGSGATLHGTVDPQGTESHYQFEYGHTTAYGHKAPETAASAGSGTERSSVSQTLGGLESNTVYHYRLVATNTRSEGGDGQDSAFKTAAPSVTAVTPNLGSPNGGTSVTLTGTNFVGVSAVKFGSKPARSFSVQSETSATAVAPEGTGTVDVTVTTPWGTTSTGTADHFTYERILWSAKSAPAPAGSVTTELFGTACASSEYCVAVGRDQVPYTGYSEVWNGSAWAEHGVATPPEGNESELRGIACSSSTACTAVGDYNTTVSSTPRPLAERWNGTAWSVQTVLPPEGAKETALVSVSCPSASECFAVGRTKNSSGKVSPFVVRWSGSGWTEQHVEMPAETGEATAFNSVSCASTSFCIAAGYAKGEPGVVGSGVVLAERWNGTSWSLASPANPAEASKAQIDSVSCPTSSFCMAAGSVLTSAWSSEMFEWTGSGWSEEPTIPSPSGLQGGLGTVSCTSAEFCGGIGSYEATKGHWVPLAETWNGAKWRSESAIERPARYLGETWAEGGGVEMTSVACTASTKCTAVGLLGLGAFGHQITLVRGETPAAPTATTGAASVTSYRTATLSGSVVPNSWRSRYYFEYGPTSSYGARAPMPEAQVSSESATEEVQQKVSLPAGRTYHYRLVARNEGAVAYGADHTIAMKAAITVHGAPAFSSNIGSAGAGNGQLSGPHGVALDPHNNLWVADYENSRVEEFNEQGEYVSQFNGVFGGSEEHKLLHPSAVAIAANGDLWVSDSGHARVLEFKTNGEFVAKANHTMSEPQGVAVAPNGNLWVADFTGERVDEFTESGTFVREIGSVGKPVGVGVDAEGHAWATDYTGGHVHELSEGGSILSTFGTSGTGSGHLSNPEGISVDANGNLWVVDGSSAGRVQEFTPGGEYITHFGGGFYYPYGMAVASGYAYVSGENKVQKWNVGAPTLTSTFASEGTGNGQLRSPQSAAVDANNNLWVADTGNDRIEEFNESGEYVKKFGSEGSGAGQFKEPKGPAIAPNGSLWISDSGNGRIQKCSTTGECTAYGSGHLTEPQGIAVAPNGNVWVADNRSSRVVEFNESGGFVREVGSLEDPIGIAVDANDDVWVTEYTGNRVAELSGETGSVLSHFGRSGSGNGTTSNPLWVATDVNGNVWVLNAGGPVQEFTPAGEYLTHFGGGGSGIALGSGFAYLESENKVQKWNVGAPTLTSTFASEGTGNGQLRSPQSAAVDANNNLWVADTGNDRIEEFNESGEYVKKFGSEGSGAGQFKEPKGPAIAPNGSLWISDSGNGRIQKCSTTGECTVYGSGHLFEPQGIAVAPNGNVWVADNRKNRVVEFNEAGEFIRNVGGFVDPIGIAVDANDDVWVGNYGENRVVELSGESGAVLGGFGKPGSGNGAVNNPLWLAADANGNVWVLNSGEAVQEFSPFGEYLTRLGGSGGSGFAIGGGFGYLESESKVHKWALLE